MIYSFFRKSLSPSQGLKYIMINREIYVEEIGHTHTQLLNKIGLSKTRFKEQAKRVRDMRVYFMLCGEGGTCSWL